MGLKKFIKLIKDKGYTVLENQKFCDHTTFKIGGKIRAFVKVSDEVSLIQLLKLVKKYKIKYFVLGRGSNLLCSDKTFFGVVIKVELNTLTRRNDYIISGAGVSLFRLNTYAINCGASGLEWSYGIPGSVGGGVKMNAGCFGKEMKDVVHCVTFTDGKKIYKRFAKDLDFGYRHSFFSNNEYVILKVWFKVDFADKLQVKNRSNEFLQLKKATQPCEFASAGSVFKRVNGVTPVPILLEKCHLKGVGVGDAVVSTRHCGFIVNTKNATFRQVFKLICKIKKTVFKKFGIILKEEIVILR